MPKSQAEVINEVVELIKKHIEPDAPREVLTLLAELRDMAIKGADQARETGSS